MKKNLKIFKIRKNLNLKIILKQKKIKLMMKMRMRLKKIYEERKTYEKERLL